MSLDPSWPADAPTPDADKLLTVLLRAISHDLASPLLTISLGMELLADGGVVASAGESERSRVGREAMLHGVQEFQRLLDGVTVISRARGRVLTPQLLGIGDLLGGHVVISGDDLSTSLVSLDPRCVHELLLALAGDRPAQVNLAVQTGVARFSIALPPGVEAFTGHPLHALFTSLQQHAGTPLVAVAAVQVQLERQGGTLHCAGGRVHFDLPLVQPGAGSDVRGVGGVTS